MNTKVMVAILILALGHLAADYKPTPKWTHAALKKEMAHVWLQQTIDHYKKIIYDMSKVECLPLVGGKENRRYNRHEDPSTQVNDPDRYWYL